MKCLATIWRHLAEKKLRLAIYLLWSYIPQVYFEWHFVFKMNRTVWGCLWKSCNFAEWLSLSLSEYNRSWTQCNGCCTWWFHLQDISAWSLALQAVSSVFYLLMSRKSNRKPKRITEWAENIGNYITYSPLYQTLYLYWVSVQSHLVCQFTMVESKCFFNFVFVLLFANHQAVTVSQFYIYMPFSFSLRNCCCFIKFLWVTSTLTKSCKTQSPPSTILTWPLSEAKRFAKFLFCNLNGSI